MRNIFQVLFYIITLSCCAFLSCSRKTNTIPEESYTHWFQTDSIDVEKVINALIQKTSFVYFTGKGSILVNHAENDLESSIQASIVYDSAMLISSKKLGIEIARMLLHQDSFKILDRIEKTYSVGNLKIIEQLKMLSLHQQLIQDLLTSGFHLPNYMQYWIETKDDKYFLKGSSESESILLIGNLYNLQVSHFVWQVEDHTLDINIEQYQTVQQKYFPEHLNIRLLANKSEKLHLQINWKHIETKAIKRLVFNIPDHYTFKLL
ncbi:MAG: DUF4292 domain-containing protein [Saprospiraceae bacterium]|nr:DUF4292 domain-containing protein [Saprospiraceae bacterium]